MREDEVYVGTKIWFSKNGFSPLAGQPPNGCDHLPTIEIKSATNLNKGSKGSFKPDLVFANSKFLILVECKPLDDREDELKLLEVLSNSDRQRMLFEELSQRGIFKRRKLEESFPNFKILESKLRLCLAHSGEPRSMDKVVTLSLSTIKGSGTLTQSLESQYKLEY
jgi:hypothetical protein